MSTNANVYYKCGLKKERNLKTLEDLDEVLLNYYQAGYLGCMDAIRAIYRIFEMYPESKKCFKKYVAKTKRNLENGNIDSHYDFGFQHEFGLGVKQSTDDALHHYRIAADHGNKNAQFALGMMYFNGFDNEQSYDEAFKLLSRSAQGHKYARYWLGVMYEYGLNDEQSYEKAYRLYQNAASAKIHNAAYRLFIAYQYGYGTDKSVEKAKTWFNEYIHLSDYKNLNSNELYEKYIEFVNTYDEKFESISKIDSDEGIKSLYDCAIHGCDRAFKELFNLSNNNNGYASYCIGELIEESKTDLNVGETVLDYYKKATKQGYVKAEQDSKRVLLYMKNRENICPRCGASLDVRPGRNGGYFKGCSNWPDCDYTTQVSTPCIVRLVNPINIYQIYCSNMLPKISISLKS